MRPRGKLDFGWDPIFEPDDCASGKTYAEMDGIELCRRIRAASQVPIIVLSVKGEEATKVKALDKKAPNKLGRKIKLPGMGIYTLSKTEGFLLSSAFFHFFNGPDPSLDQSQLLPAMARPVTPLIA